MLTLYLVRHAKTGAIAASDRDRELTADGQDDAAKLGRLFESRLEQPDYVICSPAKRTVQTFEILQANGLASRSCDIQEGIYNASPSFLLDSIKACEASSLLMIGHNPALAIMLHHLAPADDIAPDLMHFPTGTLAHITFDAADFSQLSYDSEGTLHALIRGSLINNL